MPVKRCIQCGNEFDAKSGSHKYCSSKCCNEYHRGKNSQKANKLNVVRKVGRPKTEIDWKLVENLCGIWCTGEEVAGILGISYDTLNNRVKDRCFANFSEFYKRYSANGKASLRRAQFKAAVENLNAPLLIWLGKQHLGQTDSIPEDEGEPVTGITIEVVDASKGRGK